jgi:hypothetical protein
MGNIVYNKNGDTLVRCPKSKKGCVIIPDTVKTIGLNAFSGCRGLTEVTIPNSVTLVDFRAFDECRSLKSIAIPASVTSIEEGAFLGCKCLENITVSAANVSYQSIDGLLYSKSGDTLICCPAGKKGVLALSDFVLKIANAAFDGCCGLKSVNIPDFVTTIGVGAFYGCRSLKSIAIPASVTSIEEGAFLGCKCLENITVSAANANYQSIDGLLYSKSGDTLICCPAGKKGVLILPDFVAKIGVQALDGCCGLQSVILPDSVMSIENLAFFGCQGLTSVTIGKSVSSIDYSAFFSCTHLTSVTVKAEIPPKYDAVFVLDTLYVPLHSVDLYKKASPWCKFKNIVGKKSRQ